MFTHSRSGFSLLTVMRSPRPLAVQTKTSFGVPALAGPDGAPPLFWPAPSPLPWPAGVADRRRLDDLLGLGQRQRRIDERDLDGDPGLGLGREEEATAEGESHVERGGQRERAYGGHEAPSPGFGGTSERQELHGCHCKGMN